MDTGADEGDTQFLQSDDEKQPSRQQRSKTANPEDDEAGQEEEDYSEHSEMEVDEYDEDELETIPFRRNHIRGYGREQSPEIIDRETIERMVNGSSPAKMEAALINDRLAPMFDRTKAADAASVSKASQDEFADLDVSLQIYSEKMVMALHEADFLSSSQTAAVQLRAAARVCASGDPA